VPPEMVDALFKKADADGSGKIEFPEFVLLVKGMNPQKVDEDEKTDSGSFGGFLGSFGDDKSGEETNTNEGVAPTESKTDADDSTASEGLFSIPSVTIPVSMPSFDDNNEEPPPKEAKKIGPRGAAVRKWREERAVKYEEIMTSGEVAPGEQHNEAHDALLNKKAELERQMKEIEDMQNEKSSELEEQAKEREEMAEYCTNMLTEIAMSIEDLDEILDSKLRKWSKKLLREFAAPYRNCVNYEQFAQLVRLLIPDVSDQKLQSMFEDAGVTEFDEGLMGEREFHRWAATVFPAESEAAFKDAVGAILMKAQENKGVAKAKQPEKIPPGMSSKKAELARSLFDSYDSDDSGFIDLNEFHELLSSVEPQITKAGVEKMFKECGVGDGMMDISKFYVWTMMVFGDTSDEEFSKLMVEMKAAAPKFN